MTRAGVALIAVLLVSAMTAEAQELEPRAYANSPIGLNFLILGYGYTKGDVALDSSAPIEDGKITVNSVVLAYARSLDVFGRTAKLDVVLPYAWLSGSATVAGKPVDREVSGLGDPQARFSFLFYGAPALPLEEFVDYQPDLILGASFAVTAPLGQYDSDKLVNIGTNRWSFRPELGISKALGPLTLELVPSVMFFTENNDFFGGHRLTQDPLFAVQGHLIYHFDFGAWVSLNSTYYTGGRTTVNDVANDDKQENVRLGVTVALPLNRYFSLKLYGSAGVYTRTGSNFDLAGIALQYRWGGGL